MSAAIALIAIEAGISHMWLRRNVGQPDHILANPIVSNQAERRPRPGEIWLAVTKHDGVQVDSILIDQAKFSEAAEVASGGV